MYDPGTLLSLFGSVIADLDQCVDDVIKCIHIIIEH